MTVEGIVAGGLGLNLGSLSFLSVQGVLDSNPQDEVSASILVTGIGKIFEPL